MRFIQKLFKGKKGGKTRARRSKGENPGYLACPVVAAELKRGKLDSPAEEEGDKEEQTFD